MRKAYVDDLALARAYRHTGLLWYEDGNGNDMKAVTWEPMGISPRVWRFFLMVEDEE